MEVLIAHTRDTDIDSQLAAAVQSSCHVQQKLSDRLTIASIGPKDKPLIAAAPGVLGVFEGKFSSDLFELSDAERLAVSAWNLRQTSRYQARKKSRRGEGLSWDHPDFEPEG
jgi:hypothetical protein